MWTYTVARRYLRRYLTRPGLKPRQIPSCPYPIPPCRQAKPADKPYKLSDGGGLYLLINKIGKYWHWDYRHTGKRKTLAVGVYPDTGLAKARERHQDAGKLLAEGI
ncbi:Arm DNA-binding domain-containing protein [Achromobacter seleniivolatilans]|uniref:Arm DNA-binding domain-containing protein n=1 Tax=Achromobacter seleniivolatilans TaxID=3047478 RepID=UPI003528DEB4